MAHEQYIQQKQPRQGHESEQQQKPPHPSAFEKLSKLVLSDKASAVVAVMAGCLTLSSAVISFTDFQRFLPKDVSVADVTTSVGVGVAVLAGWLSAKSYKK